MYCSHFTLWGEFYTVYHGHCHNAHTVNSTVITTYTVPYIQGSLNTLSCSEEDIKDLECVQNNAFRNIIKEKISKL